MNKFLYVIFCIMIASQVFAADYIFASQKPVKSVYVRNDDILTAKVLYTIDNTKENIILSAKSDGKTLILVNLYDEEIFVDVKVKDGDIIIKPQDWFECFKIDNPPAEVELIPPPLTVK